MKSVLAVSIFACVLCSTICCADKKSAKTLRLNQDDLSLLKKEDPAWQYRSLRIYPIVMSDALLKETEQLQQLLTLEEAMQLPGFQISEMKEFGRTEGVWYRGLTAANKTGRPVFIMAGDVVVGGNQDRVISEDCVIAAREVRNIEVFCVEAGRSHYYNPNASPAEKEQGAFYAHCYASPQIRQKVFRNNQGEVWQSVDFLLERANVESPTSAYTAALNRKTDHLAKEYEASAQKMAAEFQKIPHAVGFVAVGEGGVVMVEVFRMSKLLEKRVLGLLKSLFWEEAIGALPKGLPMSAEEAFAKVTASATEDRPSNMVGETLYRGTWLRRYSKW